jgi:hypothetical protein
MDAEGLQRLVDEDDIEGLLRATSVEETADAWWRWVVRERSPAVEGYDEPDWWAVEIWHSERIYQLPDTAQALIHALAERAPEGADLGHLGAGPIESWLRPDEALLRWVEEEARRSENFRKALAIVWISDFPADAFLRVQNAAGTQLHWPPSGHGPRPRRS